MNIVQIKPFKHYILFPSFPLVGNLSLRKIVDLPTGRQASRNDKKKEKVILHVFLVD